MIKQAIVIAAGMGKRLMPYTDQMPKCLVPVAGKPMLVRALGAFRKAGVERIIVIRGYKAEVLEARKAELGPGVTFVENREFATNNILQSLFMARQHLDQATLLSYADIVFDDDVVRELVAHPAPNAGVVDVDFAKIYEGRDQHPLGEAEVCQLDARGLITTVGKKACPPEQAAGEFIGLAKLSADGVRRLVDTYDRAAASHAAEDRYGRNTWRNAYLTDLLEDAMAQGLELAASTIRGRWREIDTTQDLARAETAVTW